eukprot:m.47348 g.47348  ORF g.47348 m.47348 type:complete len:239 (-) comp47549_c0_seq1:321-1037(-)
MDFNPNEAPAGISTSLFSPLGSTGLTPDIAGSSSGLPFFMTPPIFSVESMQGSLNLFGRTPLTTSAQANHFRASFAMLAPLQSLLQATSAQSVVDPAPTDSAAVKPRLPETTAKVVPTPTTENNPFPASFAKVAKSQTSTSTTLSRHAIEGKASVPKAAATGVSKLSKPKPKIVVQSRRKGQCVENMKAGLDALRVEHRTLASELAEQEKELFGLALAAKEHVRLGCHLELSSLILSL